MTITFGIIGCGSAANYLEQAIEACEEAVLHGIYDTNCINSVKLAEKSRAFVYTDLFAMLHNPAIEAVCICSNIRDRMNYALLAAAAGKHILLEQPAALAIEDADRIIEACRINGVTLAVAGPNRFLPAAVKLKEAMDAGMFGKLNHLNFTARRNPFDRGDPCRDRSKAVWLDAGQVLLDSIGHLDLMLWLAGEAAEISPYTVSRRKNVMLEHTFSVRCRFQSGALGIYEAVSTIIPGAAEDTAAVFGDGGTALLGGEAAAEILLWNAGCDTILPDWNPIPDSGENPGIAYGYSQVVRDMVEALQTGRQPAVTGEEGKRALALLLAIREVRQLHSGQSADAMIG